MNSKRMTAAFVACLMLMVALPANLLLTDFAFGSSGGSSSSTESAADTASGFTYDPTDVFTVGYLKYVTTGEPSGGNNGTASVVGFVPGTTSLEIPFSVTRNSKTYDVNHIAKGAFISFSYTGAYTGFNGEITLNVMKTSGSMYKDNMGAGYMVLGNIVRMSTLPSSPDVLLIPTALKYWTSSTVLGGTKNLTATPLSGTVYSNAEELFVTGPSLGNAQLLGSRFVSAYVNTSGTTAPLFLNCTGLLQAYINAPALNGTFYGCSQLETLVIGSSVSTMNTYTAGSTVRTMFEGCDALKNISVVSDNVKFASEGGLLLNKAKTDIVLVPKGSTAISVPTTVTSAIPAGSFSNMANLETISLGPMTSIRAGEFSGNLNMASITIPASVTSIDFSAFEGCVSLASISVDGSNANYKSIDNAIYSKNGSALYLYARAAESANILASVTSIGEYAFNNMNYLDRVQIPAGVTSVNVNAFTGSYSLTSITVASGNSVFKASYGILLKDSGTRMYIIPAGLSEVIIPSSVTAITDGQFAGSSIPNLYFYGNSLNIGANAFGGNSTLSEVVIESSGTITIGQNAFSGCNGLRTVSISASSIVLGNQSFDYAKTLIFDGAVTTSSNSLSGSFGSVVFNSTLSGGNPFGSGTSIGKLGYAGNPAATISGAGGSILSISSGKAAAVFSSVQYRNTAGISGVYSISGGNVYTTNVVVNLNPVFFTTDENDMTVNVYTSGNRLDFTISSVRGLTQYDMKVTANGTVLSGPNYFVNVTEDMYIMAKQIDEGSKIKVTFESNGGTKFDGIVMIAGTTILAENLPTPWLSMSNFAGWYTDMSLSTRYVLGTPVGSDVTLYAKWTSRSTPQLAFSGEGVTATVNGNSVSSGIELTMGSTVVLSYVPSFGYVADGWYINGILVAGGNTMTISNVQTDVYAYPNARYSSSSNQLTNVVEIGSLVPGSDTELLWKFTPEGISMGMSVWSMPSVPLIVDDYMYSYTSDNLYKVDVRTGEVVNRVTIPSLSAFYRYLGYGGGYIIEYNGDKVYDLDLNCLFDLGKDLSSSFYHDGYFYGLSDGKIWKFSIGGSGVTYASNGAWANGVASDWFQLLGVTSSPVFENGYVYFIEVPVVGSTYLNSRIIAAVNTETGAKTSVELTGISGRNLDDGWLTYYGGHLFLTSYLNGTNGMVTAVAVNGGVFDENSVKNIDLGFGGGAVSAFVVHNGRGYVNVSDAQMMTGRFMVFNLTVMLNGTSSTGKLYEETSVGSHGSIVVNTAYATQANGNTVYVYMIPYASSQQGVYVFTDYEGKTTAGQFYKTPYMPVGYGSQGVRLTSEGNIVWYSDSGSIYCLGMA